MQYTMHVTRYLYIYVLKIMATVIKKKIEFVHIPFNILNYFVIFEYFSLLTCLSFIRFTHRCINITLQINNFNILLGLSILYKFT